MMETNLRPAAESDAAAFLDLWDALDSETEFMLFEPNERKATLDLQKSRLANADGSDNVQILVIEDVVKGLLAGFCAGSRSSNFRDKHSLHIVIGIRQAYTGKKFGFALLSELEKWASGHAVSRLELSVMVNNSNAIALYRKLGFEIEGTKSNSVFLKSGFVDEHIMAKLI
jgi:RimJ/RimL family protein N-acetyltransferase